MNEAVELERAAKQSVTDLLTALQAGDVEKYYSLMSTADQAFMSLDALRSSMASMHEQTGRLLSFQVEGVVMHAAAGHAAAHVTLNFEHVPSQTELYHLSLEESSWRLDFDFLGIATGF